MVKSYTSVDIAPLAGGVGGILVASIFEKPSGLTRPVRPQLNVVAGHDPTSQHEDLQTGAIMGEAPVTLERVEAAPAGSGGGPKAGFIGHWQPVRLTGEMRV